MDASIGRYNLNFPAKPLYSLISTRQNQRIMSGANRADPKQSLTEKFSALAVIALLLLACLKITQPCFASIIGGTVLCVSLWPLSLQLPAFLGGRRRLAALAVDYHRHGFCRALRHRDKLDV